MNPFDEPYLEKYTQSEEREFQYLFSALDTNKNSLISAKEIVTLLRKTTLSQPILSKIWAIADTNKKGWLSKSDFFVAMKLVALAQIGEDLSTASLSKITPLPRFDYSSSSSSIRSNTINQTIPYSRDSSPIIPVNTDTYKITIEEIDRFKGFFESAGPNKGSLNNNAVKDIFSKSQLSREILSLIWKLSDFDQDGKFTQFKFIIAMFFITRYKLGSITQIPAIIPQSLFDSIKSSSSITGFGSNSGSVFEGLDSNFHPSPALKRIIPAHWSIQSPLPIQVPVPLQVSVPIRVSLPTQDSSPIQGQVQSQAQIESNKIVTKENELKYQRYFDTLDSTNKKYLTGSECSQIFLQSQLRPDQLASIWETVDHKKNGSIDRDGFVKAMHSIKVKMNEISGGFDTSSPVLALNSDLADLVSPSRVLLSQELDNESKFDKDLGDVRRQLNDIDEISAREKCRYEIERGNIINIEAEILRDREILESKRYTLKELSIAIAQAHDARKIAERTVAEQREILINTEFEINQTEVEIRELNQSSFAFQNEERSLKIEIARLQIVLRSRRDYYAVVKEENDLIALQLRLDKDLIDDQNQQINAIDSNFQEQYRVSEYNEENLKEDIIPKREISKEESLERPDQSELINQVTSMVSSDKMKIESAPLLESSSPINNVCQTLEFDSMHGSPTKFVLELSPTMASNSIDESPSPTQNNANYSKFDLTESNIEPSNSSVQEIKNFRNNPSSVTKPSFVDFSAFDDADIITPSYTDSKEIDDAFGGPAIAVNDQKPDDFGEVDFETVFATSFPASTRIQESSNEGELESINKLIKMGFDNDSAIHALKMYSFDFEKAIDYLLGGNKQST